MYCPLVFESSVGIGGFVIGLGQISFFFSRNRMFVLRVVFLYFPLCFAIGRKHKGFFFSSNTLL